MLTSDLINTAADMFNVHPRDLVGPYRFKFLMLPRFALYKALRLRGWTYPRIGRALSRDHSTIIYGAERADYYAERDAEYADKIRQLVELKYEIEPEDVAEAA